MDESNLQSEQTGARFLVDQLGTDRSQLPQGRADVGDLVRDMVQTRPASGEKAAHWRVVARRGQQLDPILSDEHGSCLDTLVRKLRAMLDRRSEETPVGRDGLVEVDDGNAEMMDAARLHTRAIVAVRSCHALLHPARRAPRTLDLRHSPLLAGGI